MNEEVSCWVVRWREIEKCFSCGELNFLYLLNGSDSQVAITFANESNKNKTTSNHVQWFWPIKHTLKQKCIYEIHVVDGLNILSIFPIRMRKTAKSKISDSGREKHNTSYRTIRSCIVLKLLPFAWFSLWCIEQSQCTSMDSTQKNVEKLLTLCDVFFFCGVNLMLTWCVSIDSDADTQPS